MDAILEVVKLLDYEDCSDCALYRFLGHNCDNCKLGNDEIWKVSEING